MFEFELSLPNGDRVRRRVPGASWQWSQAFSAACRLAEADLQLPPGGGVRCEAYTWAPTHDPLDSVEMAA